MPDYKEMYKVLFQATTQAIEILQVAQQATEEIYISEEDPVFKVIKITAQIEEGDCDK